LKARYYQTLTAVAAGLVASLPLATAGAQTTRVAPDPNAPRLLVGVFRAADKGQGVQAADAVRNRVASDVGGKQLYVLPKQDMNNALEQSGFPSNEALAPHDARALGQLLRADEIITGQVARDSAGATVVNAQVVLVRDNSLTQPLGSFRVGKPSDAAAAITREFRDAQRQFTAERDCYSNARQNKFAEAAAAARRGIASYPRATLSRICLAQTYVSQRDAQGVAPAAKTAYNDSALAIAREILAIDPLSRRALEIQYAGLQTAGRNNEATDVLLRLVAADPTNTRLLEQVVNELAANGQAARAVPFVNRLVADNPGDPTFVGLQMRVKLAAKDFKGGIAAGQELIRADTSAATAQLFTRLATAAQLDSQPQVATQLLAQGVAKFPQNGSLLVDYADLLSSSGQTQQALDLLTRAAAQNPRPAGVNIALARVYTNLKRNDDALRALQQAVAAGDSATLVANSAVQLGNTAYQAANASKSPADYQRALTILEFANRTSVTPNGQLLLGATAIGYGQQQLTVAQSTRSCEAVSNARTAFNTANLNVGPAGKANPQLAGQLLSALQQLQPLPDRLAAALKCGGSRAVASRCPHGTKGSASPEAGPFARRAARREVRPTRRERVMRSDRKGPAERTPARRPPRPCTREW
jgi:tetratricopeptide (TPR) repeat protein